MSRGVRAKTPTNFPYIHRAAEGASAQGELPDRNRVRRKLGLLLAGFAAVLCLVCIATLHTLSLLRGSEAIYSSVIQKEKVIADVLPPPAYVIESYLVILQVLDEADPATQAQLLARLGQLRVAFQGRHEFWTASLPQGELRTAFLVDSYTPAAEFYRIVDEAFTPAMARGDGGAARAIAFGELKQRYSEHRVAVDRVVKIAHDQSRIAEREAAGLIEERSLVLLALAAVIYGAVCVLGVTLSRRVFAASQILEREVSERRRTEQELRASERMRERSEQLKSALLLSVSHDLNSPLAAIDTSAALMSQADSSAEREQHLSDIQQKVASVLRFLKNLLDMSSIEAGALNLRREWQLLDEVVEGALRRTSGAHGCHELGIHLAPNLPPLFIDGVLMVQVLVNLIDNAVKYSIPDSKIEIEGLLREKSIEVRVSNVGERIPVERWKHVFTPFYRSISPSGLKVPGSGLGLAICKGIVEAHDGQIWIESRPEAKTTVAFSLPLLEKGLSRLDGPILTLQ